MLHCLRSTKMKGITVYYIYIPVIHISASITYSVQYIIKQTNLSLIVFKGCTNKIFRHERKITVFSFNILFVDIICKLNCQEVE